MMNTYTVVPIPKSINLLKMKKKIRTKKNTV